MFDEIYNQNRVPSAQSMQERNDYFDKVLGKLPQIEDKHSTAAQGKKQDMESSEGSTTAMTTSPRRVEAEVQKADAITKCEQEESYW